MTIHNKPLLPEIARPIAISYSQNDFWATYRIARALGMGKDKRTQEGGMGSVWFQFPDPQLIPLYEKLDCYYHIPQIYGHWGLDVIPALIANSKSLVVILSAHSSQSPQIQMEIDCYPKDRSIWIISIGREPVPDKWMDRANTWAIDSPVDINLQQMFIEACSRAAEAWRKERFSESYLFAWDAINLLQLVNRDDLSTFYELFSLKAHSELKLGFGTAAVKSFEMALRVSEAIPGQDIYRMAAEKTSDGMFATLRSTPSCAMRSRSYRDLGIAHMVAREESVGSRSSVYSLSISDWESAIMESTAEEEAEADRRKRHLLSARESWRKCITILDDDRVFLKRLLGFPYAALKQSAQACLNRSALEADT